MTARCWGTLSDILAPTPALETTGIGACELAGRSDHFVHIHVVFQTGLCVDGARTGGAGLSLSVAVVRIESTVNFYRRERQRASVASVRGLLHGAPLPAIFTFKAQELDITERTA